MFFMALVFDQERCHLRRHRDAVHVLRFDQDLGAGAADGDPRRGVPAAPVSGRAGCVDASPITLADDAALEAALVVSSPDMRKSKTTQLAPARRQARVRVRAGDEPRGALLRDASNRRGAAWLGVAPLARSRIRT